MAKTAKTARGQATQAALVRGAREVFERDGYIDARITDITAASGTALGSFYTYFESKEEIFNAVVDALGEEGLSLVPTLDYVAHEDDVVASISAHHRAYLEAYHRNARLMSVIEQVTNVSDSFRRRRTARAQPAVNASRDAILRLQAAGRADPKVDPVAAVRALSSMVSRTAYITFVLEEEGAEAIDNLVKTLTFLWVNALKIPTQ
ncbi:MAG TPA: TetR/AcrR family transcriptional regulator [Thermoleophilaceae bacterium]|jgi:AcrR family transcriptional regulator